MNSLLVHLFDVWVSSTSSSHSVRMVYNEKRCRVRNTNPSPRGFYPVNVSSEHNMNIYLTHLIDNRMSSKRWRNLGSSNSAHPTYIYIYIYTYPPVPLGPVGHLHIYRILLQVHVPYHGDSVPNSAAQQDALVFSIQPSSSDFYMARFWLQSR